MDSLNLVAPIVIGFLAGFIVGALFMYRGIRPGSRRQLGSELESRDRELKQYRNQITEHFMHTASLVDNLDASYRELQNHLAASAEQLGKIDISTSLLIDSENNYSQTTSKASTLIPPLDYAPKKGKIGTLNEGYGLKDDHQSKQPPSGEAYSDLS